MSNTWEQYKSSIGKVTNAVLPKAAAFGAVSLGSLMTVGDLEADIIYSGPINYVINRGDVEFIDVDGDLIDDLYLTVSNSFDADGLNGANIFANPLNTLYAQKFEIADMVPGVASQFGVGYMGWYNPGVGIYSDPWGALAAGVNQSGPVTGFMGFQFNGNYGWMQLSLSADTIGDPLSMKVIDWSYDNTGSPIMVVPEPGMGLATIALLAAGAVGLRRRRQLA